LLQNLGDLDIGVGDVGAIGQGRNGVVLVLKQSEHVGCCLAQVSICGDLGERDVVREPVCCERVADSKSARHAAFVAPTVLERRADAPSVDAVGCHVCSLLWSDVDHCFCTRRSEWAFVEVVVAIQASVG
jgi:hypothetical protein